MKEEKGKGKSLKHFYLCYHYYFKEEQKTPSVALNKPTSK